MEPLIFLTGEEETPKKLLKALKSLEEEVPYCSSPLNNLGLKNSSLILIKEENYKKLCFPKTFNGAVVLFGREKPPFSLGKYLSLPYVKDYISLEKKISEIHSHLKKHHDLMTRTPEPDLPLACGVGKSLKLIHKKLLRILRFRLKSILIRGESGTGKEVIANSLEALLEEKTPFLRINCASLSNELLESELFGHEKGAFTGAYCKQEGLLRKANGGWLFLDEVACLPLKAQASLLRFLESGEVRSVGEAKADLLKIKVIAATNESLESHVSKGSFRQDLLERLKICEITIPPFRDRSKEEKETILDHLLKKIRDRIKPEPFELSRELYLTLLSLPWEKGNIRELRNCLEGLLLSSQSSLATLADLPKNLSKKIALLEAEVNFTQIQEPRKNFNEVQKNWLLENLDRIASKENGNRLSKSKLAKALELSPWKLEKQLKQIKEEEALPEKFAYLVK